MGRRKIPRTTINGTEHKWCRKCSAWVDLSLFHKNKQNTDGLEQTCSLCKKRYVEENKEKIRERRKAYYWENPERHRQYTAEWVKKNQERIKTYKQKWYQENKSRLRDINRKWNQKNEMKKYYLDISFRLKKILRTELRSAVKRDWKKGKTLDLLGCSISFLKSHLESMFDKYMSWDNYGTYWHIDHIVPIASFDLSDPEQQKLCFHYSNLQPLEATENMRKGAKIP